MPLIHIIYMSTARQECSPSELKAILDRMLAREGRTELARACFDFLPVRASLDLAGWGEEDIFAH